MRTKNIEKFRGELYRAFKDAFMMACDDYAFTFKDSFRAEAIGMEAMRERLETEIIYKEFDGKHEAVSLPHPLKYKGMALTVDIDDGAVGIWSTRREDYFEFRGWIRPEHYRSKMAFIIAIVSTFQHLVTLDWAERQLDKIGG